MKQGFIKFKKRFQTHAIVKSVIFGASLGVLSASVLITVQKRLAVSPNPWLCVLLGVLVALVCAGAFYLCIRPTDKKLAKKLDNDLQLHEKVQTMIAFENAEGDMLQLQRADVNARLMETPVKFVKTGRLWKHIVAPVLAVAMAVVAFIVPMKVIIPTIAEDPKFEFSSWQETRLTALIEDVKTSKMEQEPKDEVVQSLETLLTTLKTVVTQSAMKDSVIATITNVQATEDKYNSYDEIGAVMRESENENIQNLAAAIAKMNALTVNQELTAIRGTLKAETLVEDMKAAETAISASVAGATEVWSEDALYLAVTALASDIKFVHEKIDEYTANWATNKLDDAFANASVAIGGALEQQRTNADVAEATVEELLFIFGIDESELPDNGNSNVGSSDNEEGEYDPEDEEDKTLNDGGLGDGEVVYGSNEDVYDHQQKEQVKYGTVIDWYYSVATEQAFGEGVSEELAELINDYFAKLYYSGPKAEENN